MHQLSQTFLDEDVIIPCKYCIYKATCEEELHWHLSEEHGVSSDIYFETGKCCAVIFMTCAVDHLVQTFL